uniref:Uncharacterized protein n=1 Tax=Anguilla anguilla TaxID=7936 RepID=A0A0E9SAX4_ANGAN
MHLSVFDVNDVCFCSPLIATGGHPGNCWPSGPSVSYEKLLRLSHWHSLKTSGRFCFG